MSVVISPPQETSSWLLVIHTNQYAGNFERELTAYCTGKIGDCGVGQEHQELFAEECPSYLMKFNNVDTIPDEHGCERPCRIWPTPGWHNTGKGGHQRGQGPFPAYMSVAIYFGDKPTKEQCDIVRERAAKFFLLDEHKERYDTPPSILGFEVLESRTSILSVERFDESGTKYITPSEA